MKNRRVLFVLFLTFLALVGAHVAVRYCGRAGGKPANRRTLVDVTRAFSRIVVSRRGEPATVLVRSADWRLESPYVGSAAEPVVKRLVDMLAMTPVDDALSESELLNNGRTRADFQLDDPELVVTLSDDAGVERISFGSRTASGSCVYAAVEGVNAVFAVPTNVLAAVNVSAKDFRRRSLFLFDGTEVSAFQIRRASGKKLSFSRDGERWRVGDVQASGQKVREFLDSLLAAEASSFVWPTGGANESDSVSAALLSAYGLDSEKAVTVVLRSVDGGEHRVSFGGEGKDSLCYALVQNGSAIVTVPAELRRKADNGTVEFTDARIFPFEASSVTAFTLTSDGADYVVAREASGGWRLDAPVSAPADAERVSAVLDRILALSSLDLRPEGLRVSVSTNVEPATVAGEKVLGALRLDDLRANDVLSVDPVLVKRLVATSADAAAADAVVFDRDRGVWNVEKSARSGSIDAKGISALLSALDPLKAVRVEKLKVDISDLSRYGLDRPRYSLAVDMDQANAVRRNILIGDRVGPGDGRFATVGSSDAVFVLSEETVKALQVPLVTE